MSRITVEETSNPTVDIHKIIDEAMEKKDRNVNIYISNHGTSIYVNPIRDEDEPHWIDATPDAETIDINGVKYRGFAPRIFKCSNCGHIPKDEPTTYCPYCGELMHGVKKEKENNND